MRRFVIAALMVVPGIAVAQDKAAMCVTAIQALDALSERLDGLADMEAAQFEAMVSLRDRIGGADGAAVEAKADAHLRDYLASHVEAVASTNEARQAIFAYCAP